jgi:hypothetical protein
MIETIVGELRALAEQCFNFSRDISAQPLSCALQELGVELMHKASTLEKSFDA